MKPSQNNPFTPWPNSIEDAIPGRGFNGTQFEILHTIIRFTQGYQRESCNISMTFLAKHLGKDRRSIQREFKKLIDRNIVLSTLDAKGTRVVKINKQTNQWDVKCIAEGSGESATRGSGESATRGSGESATRGSGESATKTSGESATHIKKKENIKKFSNSNSNSETESAGKIFKIYEQNIGVLSPMIVEDLKDLLQTHSPELIELAISEAVRANAKSIKYILGIMRNWDNAGVKTIDAAQLAISEHGQRKENKIKSPEKDCTNYGDLGQTVIV